MSGYLGNGDAEAEHAIVLNENAIHAAREQLPDTTKTYLQCLDCGNDIPELRRLAQPGCKYCIECQPHHDNHRNVKMLTKML